MFSELAKNDLEALRKSGYNPTDEEVIKLNDLANKIERGKYTTPANHPRMGFAGNVVLHEPTIGALEWWETFGRDSALTNKGRLNAYFFMLANSRNVEYLDKLQTPKEIRKAVRAWKSKCDATENELWRALMWVRYGTEDTEPKQDGTESEEALDWLWQTVIVASGSLNLTPQQLRTQTQSTITGMLIQANLRARIPMKNSVAKDYIAYRQLLKQIEDRSNG